MTDRHRALTVILDRDVRIDDLEDAIIPALRMMKFVQDVVPVDNDNLGRSIVRSQILVELMPRIQKLVQDYLDGKDPFPGCSWRNL
jgi:hypothetical protein